ncbi:ATP-binding protein [Pseudomonas sp. Choline-3u-10]|mgnify:CR=1 FL=1|uniref:Histidine kinase/HSP90-like ATPase domain-containing protein n=2 Tax=root TaxID=1 RepID=A0A6M3XC11_9ZZZZ|nr:ATP-binding protein [Stutzerimonas stutzeri]MBK3876341.1 ATP-binding protein [Stutzerimonas stutzeri]PKG90947.1 ATP-binding protein [Pseudomonas sp. Choline-3u-10]
MRGISLDRSISLPWGLGAEDADELFKVCHQMRIAEESIVLDASRLHFIDPLGMATLRALLEEQAATKDIEIQFLSTDLTGYLARMDFFKDLEIGGVDLSRIGNRQDRSGSLVEITKVTSLMEAETTASRLAEALTGSLTKSDRNAPVDEATGRNEFDAYRRPIEYSLKELLQNSLTHARREGRGEASVWVTCQYYPRKELVRMAIVDNGCGFLATLRAHPEVVEKTHQGAIEAALRPRVSCNRGPMAQFGGTENQGVGLTTTARIAEVAGGSILVASGDAMHHTGTKQSRVMENIGWEGVSISFLCKRSQLPSVSIGELLPADPAISAEQDLGIFQFR